MTMDGEETGRIVSFPIGQNNILRSAILILSERGTHSEDETRAILIWFLCKNSQEFEQTTF